KGDASIAHLAHALAVDPIEMPVRDGGALGALQERLFAAEDVTPRGELESFSASSESSEALEIVRRIVAEARRGTRFDRIAIVLRAPELYRAHLAEALRRAEVPACFSRGTRRPDPSGRALLALLACAADGLSARAFAD